MPATILATRTVRLRDCELEGPTLDYLFSRIQACHEYAT
jgi:hypothetical protein